jgi:putative ABC transport system permease protein
MNLSIARTLKRYKEVGLRRIIGSTRMQLMNLFFTESFLLITLAFTVSTGLILLVSPYFNSLSGRSIEMAIWQDKPAFLLLALCGVVIFSSVVGSSLTRSLVAINSVSAIKSGSSGGKRGGLRKTLLLFQFLITLILVTASFLIQKQVHFLQTQELGFSAHQNLVVKTFAVAGEEVDSTFQSKIQLLKGQLSENALIESVTVTSNVPGRENEWIGRLSKNGNELISSSRTRVDKDFILTYGLTLTAGRNFENEQANQVILNQSAARMLGYDSDEKAIGSVLLGNSHIVGVVKDFHERSLQEPIRPCIYTPGQGYMKFMTIRSNSDNWSQLLSMVEKDWNRVFPEKPFEYFFMDEFFNRQYGQDKRLSNVFFCFTLIGVTIACLGLFGFVYFVTHQRIKEIGIRKSLGASFQNLVLLLASEFMIILFIAGVLAGPVSYYFLQEWLSKYPVHIELEVFDFLLPVLAVAVLALCSTGVLLVRAASVNPTEVLKNE